MENIVVMIFLKGEHSFDILVDGFSFLENFLYNTLSFYLFLHL